jgi:hypothetical protein
MRRLSQKASWVRRAGLLDRQTALNEFIVDCRLRLRNLQDFSATLSQFKEELATSPRHVGQITGTFPSSRQL